MTSTAWLYRWSARVLAMIDRSPKPSRTRRPNARTSPSTRGEETIRSRPGIAARSSRSAWYHWRMRANLGAALGPPFPSCLAVPSRLPARWRGSRADSSVSSADSASTSRSASQSMRSSGDGRAVARADAAWASSSLASLPGRRREVERPFQDPGSFLVRVPGLLPAGRACCSSSRRRTNIRQGPTVISSPWCRLEEVILWPLTTTYSASGEASTRYRPFFQRIRPCTGSDPLSGEDDVAGGTGAEEQGVIARQLDELNASFIVVYFQGCHARRFSSGSM